jgi:hypothetical protein
MRQPVIGCTNCALCPPPPLNLRLVCTAKNQYRKFKTHIPRKGIAHPHSQFPHSCVCERFIYTIDLPILLLEICGQILGIYKLLTDTCMWILGLRPRDSEKKTHKWDFRCSVEQPMIVTISFEILKLTASHATQSAPQVSDSM